MSQALALLSTHPLTSERRKELENLMATDASLRPAFTAEAWQAIKAMCGGPPPGGDRGKTGKNR
jgi:hypothetical protein